MTTVREASFELWRKHGMTTIFGNPGSTELPMLGPLPEDFRYVLGLQEAVAVGMADGFAQASGSVGHVNLHTAPGLGNGVGAIFGALANKAPLLVTAGQQARSLISMQANLTNRDAVEVPKPYVKWSHEPPRPADVPFALAQAIHHASLPPAGPAFVSIPMDDWHAEIAPVDFTSQIARTVTGRAQAGPDQIAAVADRLRAAQRPVFVAGPDIDASGGWDAAIELVEAQRLPVWASPPTGGGRIGFPEDHPAFQGMLPPAVGPLAQTLAGHDLVIVAGSSVFPYYPNIPGDFLAEGTQLIAITSDPDEAARAPMGDAVVADVALTLRALVAELAGSGTDREHPPARVELEAPEPGVELSGGEVHATLAELFPPTASSCSSHRRAPWRFATSYASRGPAPTTSVPAAASASGFPLRWASSWHSPIVRSCVSWARAPRSMRSRASGLPRRMRSRSSSWFCATTSTRSSSGSPRSRTSPARRLSICRGSTWRRRRRAITSPARRWRARRAPRGAFGGACRRGSEARAGRRGCRDGPRLSPLAAAARAAHRPHRSPARWSKSRPRSRGAGRRHSRAAAWAAHRAAWSRSCAESPDRADRLRL